MARYTIYRHPQRGDVAVREGAFLLGDKGGRLLHAGYRDAGLVEASSDREALSKAQGTQPSAGQSAGQRAPQSASRTQAPTPTQGITRKAGKSVGPPVAALFRVSAAFFWFAAGIVVLVYMMQPRTQEAPASGKFSGWMDYGEIESYMARVDTQNYWVVAAEGRWRGGGPECRIRMEPAPRDRHYVWHWWCGKPREEFAQIDRDFRLQGFERVSLHSFVDEDSGIHHSGVWHRVQAP